MAVIKSSAVIRCARTQVFDALSDPRSELEWNPKVERMERIGEGPIGVGSKFLATWKLSKPVTLELTRYDRPDGWAYTNDGPISVDLDIWLEDHAEGTLLRSTFDARAHGAAKVIFPLFLIAIRREEKNNMRHLKNWLESPHS